MAIKLIVVRHGNTFRSGDVITRVGAGTDLPLVEKEKGRNIGKYLKYNNLIPDAVFSGPLTRHIQTAKLAMDEMSIQGEPILLNSFNEIDYGPDENKPEDEVIKRVGENAITEWDEKGIVPDGWLVDPDQLKESWINFSHFLEEQYNNQTVLIVSSNGIIRFAPFLTSDFESFAYGNGLKVSTGCLCIFQKELNDHFWDCKVWNLNPKKLLNI
ncbi:MULTISPECIES: histidine phosphatase family protein [unclassified Oceanispirochaeta]|uniref:histidine phosphatase family protein n=1 Tax=unclassified Oceanispirochaeta TaxID=2635722 RepID=UPI000E0998D9|nr:MULTISPECIES: histidine phosphatase family protein [unclassified Oceanispirochaeta]MBF9014413.1 histidine phosphatase family protein [Oceanispirochaeta sp. M2]NPD71299.1 histidine phosphatase family protein [Oceanispirochaeta sp. M1]RDG33680.1 histidine phosphatase family protein [Oceanispirochaeta sp. M1]